MRLQASLLLSITMLVLNGCASNKHQIDPETQKSFVDDGTDYYLADSDIDNNVGIHHNQWELDADGNPVYALRSLQGRYSERYYIGDIRYFQALSQQYGPNTDLFSIAHPDDKPHWQTQARDVAELGGVFQNRSISSSYSAGYNTGRTNRLRRNIPRDIPVAVSSGEQNSNAAPSTPSNNTPTVSQPARPPAPPAPPRQASPRPPEATTPRPPTNTASRESQRHKR